MAIRRKQMTTITERALMVVVRHPDNWDIGEVADELIELVELDSDTQLSIKAVTMARPDGYDPKGLVHWNPNG